MSDEKATNSERKEAYDKGFLDGKMGLDRDPYRQDLISWAAGANSAKGRELSDYYKKGLSDGKKEKGKK